LYKGLHRGAVG